MVRYEFSQLRNTYNGHVTVVETSRHLNAKDRTAPRLSLTSVAVVTSNTIIFKIVYVMKIEAEKPPVSTETIAAAPSDPISFSPSNT